MTTILVTGAASGIGAATCRRLAEPGISILMHTRGGADGSKQDMLMGVADQVRAKGAEVETLFSNLSEKDAARELVRDCYDRFGGLDQIVSNAGFADSTLIGDVDREVLDRSYQAMTGAFFDLVSEAMKPLKRSHCGRVVAISSFVAHRFSADALFPVTAAAKSAMEALAKSLAVQLGPDGVTVNCVAPGYTRKDPGSHRAISESALKLAAEKAATKHIAEPDDIAATVQFLLSPEARQITGQTIHVDGGLAIR